MCLNVFAQTSADKVASTGDWGNPSTWTPAGVPGDGDIILIPTGQNVTVYNAYTLQDAIMIIEGTLTMDDKLISAPSIWSVGRFVFTGDNAGVIIEDGGRITDAVNPLRYSYIDVQGVREWSTDPCTLNCGNISGSYTASGMNMGMPADLINPLPVEFLSFSGLFRKDQVELTWSTASERHNSHFDIERAGSNLLFEKIGEVQGAGDSNNHLMYGYQDYKLPVRPNENVFYYRLKQLDFDKHFEYSKIIAVFIDKSVEMRVWPIPFQDEFYIEFLSMLNERLGVSLLDNKGQVRSLHHIDVIEGLNTLQIKQIDTLPKGVYYLQLKGQNFIHQQKILTD